jgi:hypothetical protein
LDGELSISAKDEIFDHLEHCPGCRTLYDDSKLAVAMTEQLASISPAPELWNRIEREITPSPRREVFSPAIDWLKQKWVPTAAFASLLAMTALLIVFYDQDPMEQEFQRFIERREHLQRHHERLLFTGPFERNRLGRNPFSSPVSLDYQNTFEE